MNKYVIYTAIVGNYDDVPNYAATDDRFDYLLFSDTIVEDRVGIWKIRSIPFKHENKIVVARWVKMHPEELLSDYECCLWLDASFTIKSSYVYERFIALVQSSCLISTNPNPDVICVYQEMCSMMYLRWAQEDKTIRWGQYLRKENFPRWIGSCECGLLFRKHHAPVVKLLDSKWWWCLSNYARRDQFSLPYLLWKLKLKMYPFFPSGIDNRHNDHLELKEHANANNKVISGKKSCLLIRYYRKHVDERESIENVLYWVYGRSSPFFWLQLIGLFFRVKHVVLACLGKKNNTDYLAEIERMRMKNRRIIEGTV